MVLGSFNPRPHAGGVGNNGYLVCLGFFRSPPRVVSIHAPTRGATNSCDVPHSFRPVSIHAPTRGATFAISCLSISLFGKFQIPHRKYSTISCIYRKCDPPGIFMGA